MPNRQLKLVDQIARFGQIRLAGRFFAIVNPSSAAIA
jgi:regulator of extracellular matrix RemA (YlzA/DUF370 family)